MCSVTWWRDPGGYGVCFNRDERRSRPQSLPVAIGHTDGGEPYLAPRDPLRGGSWLAVNAHGLIAGVLNHYAAGPAPGRRSRGELPPHLAACRDRHAVAVEAAHLDWSDFAPCLLVAWDADGEACWTWDGATLAGPGAPPLPLTTSSHRSSEVCAWRAARLRGLLAERRLAAPDAALCEAFHADAIHPDGAFNVRMRRADARTESLCRVEVTAREVRHLHQRERAETLAALDLHEARIPRA